MRIASLTDDELEALVNAGLSDKQIAEQARVSPMTITDRRRLLGFLRTSVGRPRQYDYQAVLDRHAQGLCPGCIARALNYPRAAVRQIIRRSENG